MNLPHKLILLLVPMCLYIGSLTMLADTTTDDTSKTVETDVENTAETTEKIIETQLSDNLVKDVDWYAILPNIIYLYFAATLVEAGLGVIFRWRVWVRYFDSKGIKVPIIILYSALLLYCTRTDPVFNIFKDGLKLENMEAKGDLCTGTLSALLIAGGSAGVIALYKKLRLRDNGEATNQKKDLERSKRRFKLVKVLHKEASPNFPIQVILDNQIIGTIPAGKNSFAAFGGQVIGESEKPHNLALKGYDKDGNPIDKPIISDFKIAPGATAEFEGVF